MLAFAQTLAGLAHLASRRYKLAADVFTKIKYEECLAIPADLDACVAPREVAVYGVVCALATYDRADLRQKLVDGAEFRQFLELVPDMVEIVKVCGVKSRETCCLRAG